MSKDPLSLPTSLFIFKNLTCHGFWQSRWYDQKTLDERLQMMHTLTGLIREGKASVILCWWASSSVDHRKARKPRTRDFSDRKSRVGFGCQRKNTRCDFPPGQRETREEGPTENRRDAVISWLRKINIIAQNVFYIQAVPWSAFIKLCYLDRKLMSYILFTRKRRVGYLEGCAKMPISFAGRMIVPG